MNGNVLMIFWSCNLIIRMFVVYRLAHSLLSIDRIQVEKHSIEFLCVSILCKYNHLTGVVVIVKGSSISCMKELFAVPLLGHAKIFIFSLICFLHQGQVDTCFAQISQVLK